MQDTFSFLTNCFFQTDLRNFSEIAFAEKVSGRHSYATFVCYISFTFFNDFKK